MRNHPEVKLCGHTHRAIKQSDMRTDWELGKWRATPVYKWPLLFQNQFVTPSIMVRSDIHQRFSAGRRYMEDHLLWLDIACDGCRIDRLGVDLAATYKTSYGVGGLSANLWEMERSDLDNYRLLRARVRLSLLRSYALMKFSLLNFIRRLGMVTVWQIFH
jgi:hypothetical protein